jgi:hypothetical protein
MANLLDDLVLLAEMAAKERKSAVVSDIMSRMLARESACERSRGEANHRDVARRLFKGNPLRCVASQLAVHPARRDEYVAILSRAGEDGADALIEQIGAVAHQRDRHVYFGALMQPQGGRGVAAAHARGPAVVRRPKCCRDARRAAGA